MYTNDQSSLCSVFVRYALSQAGPRANRELAHLSTRDFLNIPAEQRTIGWIGHAQQRCPGYFLEGDVLNAVRKLGSSVAQSPEKSDKFFKALKGQPELMMAPFPLMWLEWRAKYEGTLGHTHKMKNGLFLENARGDNGDMLRGYIICHGEHNGIWPEQTPEVMSFEYRHRQEVEFFIGGQSATDYVVENLRETGSIAATSVFMLMILKSRTSVLKLVEPSPSRERLRIISESVRQGKPANKPLGILTFDLSRTLSKGRAKNEAEARKFLEEQIVSGHFKLREVSKRDDSGRRTSEREHQLVWWSPHFRGGTHSERDARAEQPVVKSRWGQVLQGQPGKPLFVPGFGGLTRNEQV